MTETIPVFDPTVLKYVNNDEEAKHFAYIHDFKDGRYFMKTVFHGAFVERIKDVRETKQRWNYISGIQGLGKTSSVLYYVLECRKNGDSGVHYVDLDKIERKDRNLETFTAFSRKFEDQDCLLVDHLTHYNSHYLDEIVKIVKEKDHLKFILIETGFTACVHTLPDFGRTFQLNEDHFQKMWNGSLENLLARKDKEDSSYSQKMKLKERGKDVFAKFSKDYIMTPRLLNDVLEDMYTSINRTLEEAFTQYTKERQNAIKKFEDHEGSSEFAQFQLHTTVLLNFIPDGEEYIFRENQIQKIMLGINIFEIDYCRVTKEDLTNMDFSRLNLDLDDVYVKVRHLVPILASYWRERLPYNPGKVLENAGTDEIFAIMFQNGEARKEFEKLFVETQQRTGFAIVPNAKVSETSYQPSQQEQEVTQSEWKIVTIPSGNFFEPNITDLDSYQKDVPGHFKGHEKNVALFAVSMKRLLETLNSFVVYPQVQNFMGVDYFVYHCEEKHGWIPPKRAKLKENSIMYLFQVATGASHRGDTIGQALNVVKEILSNENVTVHAVVITASNDVKKPYLLTKCAFEDLSVLNLYVEDSKTAEELLQKNELWYKLYLKLSSSLVPGIMI